MCVCAHAFVSSAQCPLKLVRRAVWQAIQRLCVQLLLCVTSLFHLASLQAGGEMGYTARQGRWLIPSSAGAGLHPWFLIHQFCSFFLSWHWRVGRELGCFEGEVPAESLVTRQAWAITINCNNFHLPCNCNHSQLVSWLKFRGFPLSPFLPSAFPTCTSCPSLSQSLSGLALCLPEKVPPDCAALWKAMAFPRALPLRLWLQRGCCGVAHSLPGVRWGPGCLLSPHPFNAQDRVWICFPESSPCLKFAWCQKGCWF